MNQSSEFRKAKLTNLVDEYKMGLNCKNNNAKDLAEKIILMYEDENLRRSMSENSRRLANEKFDRKKTYQKIVELI